MATSDIGVGLRVDGEKEFKQAIADINREVKLLNSEMRLCSESFKGNASSQEALTQKSDILNRQILTQLDKIKELRQALNNAEQEYGANSKQALSWRDSLLKAETDLAKYNNELEDVNRQLQELDEGTGEAAKGTKDLGDSFTSAERTSGALGGSISSLTVAMGNLLADAIRSAATAIKEFAQESIQLASDLEEVKNVVDTTFGDNSQAIYDFANTASNQFGLTGLEAQQYAGRIGAALKAMGFDASTGLEEMTTSLVGLSGDLASFYNISADEAYTKIFSGVISGETEGLKQLGVVMTEVNLKAFAMEQGITKSYSAMTAAEKAQLRYQYLLSATADAQGDFARTSDSYANQTKILQMNLQNLGAMIGADLLPMLTQSKADINGLLSDMIEAYGEGGMGAMLDAALDGFVEFKHKLAESIKDLLPQGIQAATYFLQGITDHLPDLLEGGGEMLKNLVVGIARELPTLIGTAIDMVAEFAASLLSPEGIQKVLNAGIEIGKALWEGIKQMINETKIGQFISGILSAGGAAMQYDDVVGYVGSPGGPSITINGGAISSATIDYAVAKANTLRTPARATR